jgi:hypothetical protein
VLIYPPRLMSPWLLSCTPSNNEINLGLINLKNLFFETFEKGRIDAE